MDKTYWLTDEDEKGLYKILPPATYFCAECKKAMKATPRYAKEEIMYEVRACQHCGGIIAFSM